MPIISPLTTPRPLQDTEPTAKPHAFAIATLAMAAIVIATVVGWWMLLPEIAPKRIVIAVLPFADRSEARDQQFLADGIAADVAIGVAQVPEFVVIGRATSFGYRGERFPMRQLADDLGATYVIAGSVRRQEDRLWVTARLTDLADFGVLWKKEWQGVLADVFAIRDEISHGIASKLLLLGDADVSAGPAIDAGAYEVFLRARSHGDAGEHVAAIELAEESLQLDAENLYAHYYLAFIQHQRRQAGARAHVDAALNIDADFRRALSLQVRLRYLEDGDVIGYYRGLADLVTRHRDAHAARWLADLYAAAGRDEDASTLRRYLRLDLSVSTIDAPAGGSVTTAFANVPWRPATEILFARQRTSSR